MRRLAFPDADAHVMMPPGTGARGSGWWEMEILGLRGARLGCGSTYSSTQWHWRRGAPTPAGGVTRYALHMDGETASDRQAGARGSAGRAIARLRRAVAAGAGMFEFCKGGVS